MEFKKTEALIYQLGALLCHQGPDAGPGTTPVYLDEETKQIERILASSTVVLAPDIPQYFLLI